METRTIDNHEYYFTLGDDGTLDTVVEVFDKTSDKTVTWRYCMETASYYRDRETGCLDFDEFIDDIVGPDASAHDWGDVPAVNEPRDDDSLFDDDPDLCRTLDNTFPD